MNSENKSRIISSLGSWKALRIVIHLLSWKWLGREEDSILSLSLIFFLFKKLRYKWHIILALDMQHKDLISVYIAKWSPQYIQLPSKFDIFLLAIKEKMSSSHLDMSNTVPGTGDTTVYRRAKVYSHGSYIPPHKDYNNMRIISIKMDLRPLWPDKNS